MILVYKLNALCDMIDNKSINLENNNFREILAKFGKKYNYSFSTFDSIDPTTVALNLIQYNDLNEEETKYLYTLLYKFGYRSEFDIINALFRLGRLENPDNNNNDIIKKLLTFPSIEDISESNGNFKIDTNNHGIFTFSQASSILNNDKLSEYIFSDKSKCNCHNNTLMLSKLFPKYYSVTSLCKSYFNTDFVHSYNLDSSKHYVIDLCANTFMDKESFDYLYNPSEENVLLNSDIDNVYNSIIQNNVISSKMCTLLCIYLYNMYTVSMENKKVLH